MKLPSDLQFVNLIISLGILPKDYIEKILKINEKALVVIIDNDESLANNIAEELKELLYCGRLLFLVGKDIFGRLRHIVEVYFGLFTTPYIKIIENKGRTQRYIEFFNQIKKEIQEIYAVAQMNLSTLTERVKLWHNNLFENLPFLLQTRPINFLFKKFKNYCGFLISAGPSLDKNKTQLIRAKTKGIILSVDTAAKSLLKEGIIPDFIVTIDASEKNYNLYLKDLPAKDKLKIIASWVVHKQIFLDFKEIYTCGFGYPTWEIIEKVLEKEWGRVMFGGSVSTVGFDILCKFGCNPIVFVGQDLSYPDGKVYTDGVDKTWQAEVKKIVQKMPKIEIESIDGEKILTTPNMWVWLRWFESQIRINKDIFFINATEGGAKIEGTKVMKLKDVIDKYCKGELKLEMQENISFLSIIEISRLILFFEYLKKNYQKIQRLVDEAYKILKNVKVNYKKQRELALIYQKIIQKEEFIHPNSWLLEPTLALLEELKIKNKPQNLIYKVFFKNINDVLMFCLEKIDKCLNELQALLSRKQMEGIKSFKMV